MDHLRKGRTSSPGGPDFISGRPELGLEVQLRASGGTENMSAHEMRCRVKFVHVCADHVVAC